MFDVRRLVVLEAVVRHGSFTAAARSLNYTQSAISQQVAALERECGVKLVIRAGRELRLSSAGEILAQRAPDILAAVADAEAELRSAEGNDAGDVRVAVLPSVGATLVPLAVESLRREHPDTQLAITGQSSEAAINGLVDGTYDAVVGVVPPRVPRPRGSGHAARLDRLEHQELLVESYVVVLPSGHPLADRDELPLESLRDEAWIVTGTAETVEAAAEATALQTACQRAGITPRMEFHVADHFSAQGFVAAEMGVALMPRLALAVVRPDVVVRTVVPTLSRRIEAVTVRSRRRTPGVAAVLATFRAVLSGIAAQAPGPAPRGPCPVAGC